MLPLLPLPPASLDLTELPDKLINDRRIRIRHSEEDLWWRGDAEESDQKASEFSGPSNIVGTNDDVLRTTWVIYFEHKRVNFPERPRGTVKDPGYSLGGLHSQFKETVTHCPRMRHTEIRSMGQHPLGVMDVPGLNPSG